MPSAKQIAVTAAIALVAVFVAKMVLPANWAEKF